MNTETTWHWYQHCYRYVFVTGKINGFVTPSFFLYDHVLLEYDARAFIFWCMGSLNRSMSCAFSDEFLSCPIRLDLFPWTSCNRFLFSSCICNILQYCWKNNSFSWVQSCCAESQKGIFAMKNSALIPSGSTPIVLGRRNPSSTQKDFISISFSKRESYSFKTSDPSRE